VAPGPKAWFRSGNEALARQQGAGRHCPAAAAAAASHRLPPRQFCISPFAMSHSGSPFDLLPNELLVVILKLLPEVKAEPFGQTEFGTSGLELWTR